jgi:hypothetical protein
LRRRTCCFVGVAVLGWACCMLECVSACARACAAWHHERVGCNSR